MPEYPFPEVFDSSMIATWRGCQRQFYYSYIQRIKPKGESIDLVAGQAFARGLEAARLAFYQDGKSFEDAVAMGLATLWKDYGDPAIPEGHPKTWNRMTAAYESFFAHWPMNTDLYKPAIMGGKAAVEFTFCLPLPGTLHPVTGQPLLIAGRCDAIMALEGMTGLYCEDDKTTKYFKKTWASDWSLRNQFMTYFWAARQYGFPIIGVYIRGTAILKTEIQHQDVPVLFSNNLIDHWHEQLYCDLRDIQTAWMKDYWGYNFSDSCTSYSGCPFQVLCKSNDPEKWMPLYFEPNTWTPLRILRPDQQPKLIKEK